MALLNVKIYYEMGVKRCLQDHSSVPCSGETGGVKGTNLVGRLRLARRLNTETCVQSLRVLSLPSSVASGVKRPRAGSVPGTSIEWGPRRWGDLRALRRFQESRSEQSTAAVMEVRPGLRTRDGFVRKGREVWRTSSDQGGDRRSKKAETRGADTESCGWTGARQDRGLEGARVGDPDGSTVSLWKVF